MAEDREKPWEDALDQRLALMQRRIAALHDAVEVLALEFNRWRGEHRDRAADMLIALQEMPALLRRGIKFHIQQMSTYFAADIVERLSAAMRWEPRTTLVHTPAVPREDTGEFGDGETDPNGDFDR